ncbi:MAG: SDR family NAD(P)-dependent oxidoreductase [Chloroflexi bacterium]|nr:SDR family NAD(P)-dependent oxidoreductase [Chloroflexota bacterium]MCC6891471.1 SDR family NAD(P)-dependent oxidoreductase [Anaerolineae bacterium]
MNKHAAFKQIYGPWALVTGGSAGIGAAFAWILAERGINLVLIARNPERLEEKAAEIQTQHPNVQIITHALDLSLSDSVASLINLTADLEIGLVVANAAMETSGGFLNSSFSNQQRLIQLNITTPAHLAHHYGRLMRDRKRGGILFVASIAAYGPLPYLANYAASKAYLLSLGEALHYELKPYGVDVLVLSPGLIDTSMAEQTAIDWSLVYAPYRDADSTALAGIRALGRKSSVIPGTTNWLVAFARKYLLTRSLNITLFGHLLRRAITSSRL